MERRITRRTALVLAASAATAACAAVSPASDLLEQPPPQPLDQEYLLGAGDRVRITVFGETDLTGEYAISDQGTVAFPLVGEIEARDKTLVAFAGAITERLRAGYVRNPRVSVEILAYRPFFILGEVESPGSFPYSANMTVMNAVATAGGFTYRADQRRVFIKRAGESEERAYRLSANTRVLPGDTVRIPERLF